MTGDPQHRPRGAIVADFIPPARTGPAVIEGRTVRLERLDPSRHAAAIHRAAAGADWLWDYLGYGPFAAEADYVAWAETAAASVDPVFYAIVEAASGQALGVASFLRIEPVHGVIEIGHILITTAMQRTTAASEAIMRMAEWAFDAGYRRVEWKCDDLNAPSRAAALRFGFAYEGTFRHHMIIKGRNRDTAWYAITASEWPEIRARWTAWLDPANFDEAGQQRRSLSRISAPETAPAPGDAAAPADGSPPG